MKKALPWLALYVACILATLLSAGLIYFFAWIPIVISSALYLAIAVLTVFAFWIKNKHQQAVRLWLRIMLCIPIAICLVFLIVIGFVDTPAFHFPP